MRAGSLREFVTIRRATRSGSDPAYGPATVWANVATVSAQVLPAAGGEAASDEGTQTHTAYTVRLRYRPDLSSTDRLCWRGKTLELLAVLDPDGLRRTLEVTAREYPGVA